MARRKPREQVPRAELDARPFRTAFAPATSSAPVGHVDSRHARAGVLVRDRQRDRAAAGPDVEHVGVADLRQAGEAALDDDLGLGPWDENPPIDRSR